MNKLILHNVSDEYINYLRIFEKKVFSNKEECRKHMRKYLGIVLSIEGFNYFVPLSSPKDTDYLIIDGITTIRKSIIPIMRIISKDKDGNDELKGTIKFSNMIPVPDCALLDYDIEKELDEDYKILVLKEIDFISSNKITIIKNANIIHNQKIKNMPKINYLKDTVNFKLVEQKMLEYLVNIEVSEMQELVAPLSEESLTNKK